MLAVLCLTLVSALVGTVSAAPFNSSSSLETRAAAKVYYSCTKPMTAALTFDDGPYVNNAKILKTLNDAGAKGTFFVNGNNYGCIYSADNAKRVKAVYDGGHQIASHTWAHKHLNSLSTSALTSEFSKTDTAIKKITGAVPAFMRPPYGEFNQNVKNVAGARGQSIVIWDFDSGDSIGATATQSKADYKKLADKKPNNILALNHETVATTANTVLPYAIKTLQAKGYKLVTVAECLGKAPYKSTGTPAKRDSTWKC